LANFLLLYAALVLHCAALVLHYAALVLHYAALVLQVPWHEGGIDPRVASHREYLQRQTDDLCQRTLDSMLAGAEATRLEPNPLYTEAFHHLSFMRAKSHVAGQCLL
jgi:hypothetical protein